MITASKLGAVTNLEGLPLILFWLGGPIIWLWGCFHFVAGKRLPLYIGFLGIFFILGFLIILFLATKQPEFARAAARRKAANPSGKYRGDPTSLY